MHTKTLGFIGAVIILIVILLTATYVVQTRLQRMTIDSTSPTSVVPVSPTPQQNTALKTYTSSTYGYEISYDAKVYTLNPFSPEPKEDPAADTVLFFKTALINSPEPLASLTIHASSNPKALSSKEYFTQMIDDTGHTATQNIIFKGLPALEYGNERDKYILVTNDVFAFTLSTGDQALLSKFRFTNPPVKTKTYGNTETGFSFTYPEKLKLIQEKNKVAVSHDIPYKNHGCDMSGDTKTYSTLTDFKIELSIHTNPKALPYIDGQYSAGTLKGSWAYEGAEGCGYSTYHFPLAGNKTLIVTRESIQQLSGAVTDTVKDEVLKTPGAISSTESDEIFEAILTSFKFNQ